MTTVQVTWTELLGCQLQTATGAPFTVVRVSATHVAIRPKGGRRDYALSIPRELEPAVGVYAAGNLPAPGDLRRLGVRPVLTSYAWGILKAVVQERIGVRVVARAKLKDFAGTWVITDMADIGDEYWADQSGEPYLRLEVPRGEAGLWGAYEIGLSSGSIEGALREFGGASVIVFGYDGMDEMDPSSSGGWLQLLASGTLEGEFMGPLGWFSARRKAPSKKPVTKPSRARGWAMRLR